MLDKIDRMDPPSFTTRPKIHFHHLLCTYHIMLESTNLMVGYDKPLLPEMNFEIENGEKVVITGFNGIGKTTLLRTLMGEIAPLKGDHHFSEDSKIGYYQQDLLWEKETRTPIEIISQSFPKLTQKEVRKALARTGIKAEHAMQAIGTLSGGEQAKVNLCRLTLTPTNLLILDEPTNHLDVETKEELQKALKNYAGTMIIVSHEASFYRDWATRIVNICDLCEK